MASWSTRRKYTYFFIAVGVIILTLVVPVSFILYDPPTCFDREQNGSERGIDCGGSCVNLCAADYASPRVFWSYSSRIVDGVYNTMAYAQNPNQSVEAEDVSYVFKLYDKDGILITRKEGKAFVPAGQKFAIFEGGLQTGVRIPARTTFEFTSTLNWQPGQEFTAIRLINIEVTEGTEPRAEAKVENITTNQAFSNVLAFIVLYDKEDNRLTFSKTVIPTIYPGQTQSLYFTWPEAFSKKVFRSEMLIVPNPR